MYWLFLLWVIDTGTFAKDYVQSSTYLLDLTNMRVVLHCIQIQKQVPEIFLILEANCNQNKTQSWVKTCYLQQANFKAFEKLIHIASKTQFRPA